MKAKMTKCGSIWVLWLSTRCIIFPTHYRGYLERCFLTIGPCSAHWNMWIRILEPKNTNLSPYIIHISTINHKIHLRPKLSPTVNRHPDLCIARSALQHGGALHLAVPEVPSRGGSPQGSRLNECWMMSMGTLHFQKPSIFNDVQVSLIVS